MPEGIPCRSRARPAGPGRVLYALRPKSQRPGCVVRGAMPRLLAVLRRGRVFGGTRLDTWDGVGISRSGCYRYGRLRLVVCEPVRRLVLGPVEIRTITLGELKRQLQTVGRAVHELAIDCTDAGFRDFCSAVESVWGGQWGVSWRPLQDLMQKFRDWVTSEKPEEFELLVQSMREALFVFSQETLPEFFGLDLFDLRYEHFILHD